MTDKKLDKTTLSIIAIIVILIAVAILIWLSQRKKAEEIIDEEDLPTPKTLPSIESQFEEEYRGYNIFYSTLRAADGYYYFVDFPTIARFGATVETCRQYIDWYIDA